MEALWALQHCRMEAVQTALSTLAVGLVRTLAQAVAETRRLALPTAALGTCCPLASGPVVDQGKCYLLASVQEANLQHQGICS